MEPFNPLVEGYHERLYEIYRQYREKDPVHWCGDSSSTLSGWCVFRYTDVNFVLKDSRFVREYAKAIGEERQSEVPVRTDEAPSQPPSFWQMASQWMLFRDPPDHTRLRRLVNKAFVPRVVEGLADRIEAIARELLQAARREGGMDLIADYAFPLPVIVIAELLGIPAEDRQKLREWSNAMMTAINGGVTEEQAQEASRSTAEISEYLGYIIEKRRKEPAADLLSGLIRAREKEDRLSEQELVAMAILLLVAGHETTVNLIGNGAFALLNHPDQMALLKREPARATNAVEEILRFDAPIQATSRFAATDVTLGGKLIRRGDEVFVMIGSANRDPKINADPDRFDITREEIHHLGFGGGIHYCLGAPLARLEGKIALTTLLSETSTVRLAGEEPVYREGMVSRGLVSLPVELA